MTSEQKYNTMKIVFEALNKQVPQKPEKAGFKVPYLICPCCKEPLTNEELDMKYPAHSCGQMIDWDSEEMSSQKAIIILDDLIDEYGITFEEANPELYKTIKKALEKSNEESEEL